MAFHRLIIGHMLIGRSVAGSLEDFSNNLVSDLGPLLSLFGDSMAKQFLSESTTFLDYIIFAVAPIGIITAIVSAIRLCGSAALRAFIGRSQEGQGAVEAELCTSTSRDVCELFTRGGIQRVLGTPHILELVYIPRTSTSTSKESQLLLSRDYFTERARAADSPWKLTKGGSSRPEDNANSRTTLAPNPNLSLNIGIRRPPQWLLWIIATSGLFLQAGVLVLSGIGVWILKWNPSEGTIAVKTDRAAVLFISGTVLMVAGMWGCAFLIGQTTHEVCFQRKTSQGKSGQPQLLWLQPGRQVIGDQSFDPFAYLENTGERSLQTWMSSRKISAKHFELFTYLSVLATVIGYIVQFIGLRGLKVWVAVAQLSLTVVMSCIRGLLRAQRLGTNDNELEAMPDMVAGHELDWLAFRLDRHTSVNKPSWHVTGQHEQARDTTVPANDSETDSTYESKPIAQTKTTSDPRTASVEPVTRSTSSSISSNSNDNELLQIRLRLAHLTGLHSMRGFLANHTLTWDDQHVKVRAKARQLSHAIGTAATHFFLRSPAERNNAVELYVRAASHNDVDKGQRVGVILRPPPEFSQGGWHIDPAQVEAILGLWVWTMSCELTVSESKLAQDLDISAVESLAENIQVARIVSFGVDGPQWEDQTNYQGEMDLWLGRGAIKFRQSTMKLMTQGSYGLATIFSKSGKDQQGDWEAQELGHTPQSMSRYAGWNGAHRALAAIQTQSQGGSNKENSVAKFRLQVTQVSQDTSSLLDICCQELFVALIVSLLEYDNAPIGDAAFVESGGLLRLEHPTVSIFADAFVEGELGTYADALLCVVPALRSILPSLNPETMLPALTRTADTYRRESQWARAEKVLVWACARTNNRTTSTKHFEYSLRAICELYRWSLSAFSDAERVFGLKGIENVVQTYSGVGTSHAGIKTIIDSYQEIARRFKSGDADKDRGRGMPSCFKKNQQQLLYSLRWGKRTEALYYICLLTPESLQESVVPESALSLAARNNWVEVVDVLLKMKARPNDRDDFGLEIKSGIFHCAELGHDECARILLDHGASLDDTVFKSGSRHTLFTVAARNGHLNMIELLLDKGCKDMDQTDSRGYSPLAIAAKHGHTQIVEILLKTDRVSLDREVHIDGTPLELAAKSNHVDVVKLLLNAARMQLGQQHRNWGIALWWAASHGNEEGVKDFIDGGANIEFKDKRFQQTALARAVVNGQVAVVQQLLQCGADANTQDNEYKNTPLMEACSLMYDSPSVDEDPEKAKNKKEKSKASKAIAELLITKGAKLELQNKKGLSTLALAAQKGHIMCLELLLAKGADIESRDLKKHTPLMHAIKYHRIGAILVLLRNGANLEARDAKGKTPLFHAFNNRAVGASDNQKTLDLLIRKGADKTAKDNEGYTALMRVEQWEKAKSARTEQWEKIKPGRVPPSKKGGKDADGKEDEARVSKRRGSWGGM